MTYCRRFRDVAVIAALCSVTLGAQSAISRAQRLAIVKADSAPVFASPGVIQPLRVFIRGATLAVVDTQGKWLRVEFDDSYGRRAGYIEARFVDVVNASNGSSLEPQQAPKAPAPATSARPPDPRQLTVNERTEIARRDAPPATVLPPVRSDDGRFTVRVYVEAVPPERSAEGFIDATNKWEQDSVADLKKQLHNKSFNPNKGWPGSKTYFEVVGNSLAADLTVTIVTRGVSTETYGQRTAMTFYRNVVLADTVPKVGYTRWVSAVIGVGDYRREMVGWSTIGDRDLSWGAWTEASRQLALVTASWVMANEGTIRERQRTVVAERFARP